MRFNRLYECVDRSLCNSQLVVIILEVRCGLWRDENQSTVLILGEKYFS